MFHSPYLLGISVYVLLMTITATFIYFTRLQMVAALGDDTDMRATVFAQIDPITQVTTLLLQLVVTGHLMKRLGVAVALAMLPVVVSLGFIGLAIAGSFAVLVLSTRRSARFSAPSPGRRAKRCSPSSAAKTSTSRRRSPTPSSIAAATCIGAWTEGGLGRLGMAFAGLAALAVPLACVGGPGPVAGPPAEGPGSQRDGWTDADAGAVGWLGSPAAPGGGARGSPVARRLAAA